MIRFAESPDKKEWYALDHGLAEKVFDEKVQKGALDVFKFVLDTAAATIIGKRVIVPLIATPFASKVEKWLDKREKMKNGG